MSEYRFHLQKYRPGSKKVCPKCGRKSCFTPYVDGNAQITFPNHVGKCDHINSCGYHYTPKEYFQDNPTIKETMIEQNNRSDTPSRAVKPIAKPLSSSAPQTSYLPSDWVSQSMQKFDVNPLYRYLTKVAGKEKTDRLFNLYKVGTSKMWNGATVFWQIDINGNVRAGKIMGYDAKTGHRIKHPFNQVNWVHSVKRVPDFHMKQCLFGEHLLSETSIPASTVAIVESEKTALIAALFIPDFVWLATGGMKIASLIALNVTLPIVMVWVIQVLGIVNLTSLKFLGGISYELYLVHGIFIYLSKNYYSYGGTLIIVCYTLSIVTAFMLNRGSKYINNKIIKVI